MECRSRVIDPSSVKYGPEYLLLTKALAGRGMDPLRDLITNTAVYERRSGMDAKSAATSRMDQFEIDLLEEVFQSHEGYSAEQLSALTRGSDTAWNVMRCAGGEWGQIIPDGLVRAQFLELAGEPVSTIETISEGAISQADGRKGPTA